MTTAMQTTNGSGAANPAVIERVLALGDLKELTPRERVAYYLHVCESTGLNPATRPFEYISLNGKLTLYSTKNCTDQLRSIHAISVVSLQRENVEGVHVVTATVMNAAGRRDEDVGAVSVANKKGEDLANALMKATTKAKRRATLSICGLSFLDESELESVKSAKFVTVTEDGEIVEPKPDLAKALAASVDQSWPKWQAEAIDDMRAAAMQGKGAFNGCLAEMVDELKKLQPPRQVVDALYAERDAILETFSKQVAK